MQVRVNTWLSTDEQRVYACLYRYRPMDSRASVVGARPCHVEQVSCNARLGDLDGFVVWSRQCLVSASGSQCSERCAEGHARMQVRLCLCWWQSSTRRDGNRPGARQCHVRHGEFDWILVWILIWHCHCLVSALRLTMSLALCREPCSHAVLTLFQPGDGQAPVVMATARVLDHTMFTKHHARHGTNGASVLRVAGSDTPRREPPLEVIRPGSGRWFAAA
jgi:hypothetical protein